MSNNNTGRPDLSSVMASLIAGELKSPHFQSGGNRLEVIRDDHRHVIGVSATIDKISGLEAWELGAYRGALKRAGWQVVQTAPIEYTNPGKLNKWLGVVFYITPIPVAVKDSNAGQQAALL
jgi:hypothetical protein